MRILPILPATQMEQVYRPSGAVLLKCLGTGSHASVYLMRDDHGAGSAFKLFNRVTPEILQQARREAKFLHHMSRHPVMHRFVPAFIGSSEKPLYTLMEYLEGRVLDAKLFDAREFDLFVETASAFLSELHTRFNLCLRDISPRNIMVCINNDKEQPNVGLKVNETVETPELDRRFVFIDFEQISEIGKPYKQENSGTPRYVAPSQTCQAKDDFLALAFVCLEYQAELPWRNLRDLDSIFSTKCTCLKNCEKYFGYIEHPELRRWVFDYYGCSDSGEVKEYVDYSEEFKDTYSSLFKKR